MSGGKFAQLGADDVIRFLDVDHFLEELGGNLGRGRAIARTRRSFEVDDRIRLKIEAPNVDWAVACEARIVVVRDGFLGLELMQFEQVVLPKLEDLGLEAKQNAAAPPAEKTVIAPMPDLMNRGASTPSVSAAPEPAEPPVRDDDDSPVSRPPLAGRRRRPRPLPADRAPVDRDPTRPPSQELERSSASLPPPVAPSVSAGPERSSASLPPPVAPSVAEAERSSASLPPPVAPSVAEAERSSASLPPPVAPSVAEAERSSASLPPPVAPSVAEAERSSASLPPPVAPSVARSVEPPVRPKPVPRAASAITSAPPASPPPMLAQEDLLVLDISSRLTPNPLLAPAQVRDETPADISTSVELRPDLESPAQVPQVDEVRPAAKTMATPIPSEYAAEDPADRSAPDSLDDLVIPSADARPAPDTPDSSAAESSGATEDDLLELADVPDLEDDAAPDDTAELEPELALPPSPAEQAPPPAVTEASQEAKPDSEVELEAEPEVEAEPEPEPGPPPPEPEPQVPVHNAQALEDKHAALPRVTRGGVLRVSDSATLLGLYLSQARHGRLTVLGPLPGEPGDETALKIVGSTVVSLPAEIIARVGEWVTLSIPSADPLQEVLRDSVDSWMSELPAQPAAPVAAAVLTPQAPAPEAVVIAPAAPAVIVPDTPSSPPEPIAAPPAAKAATEAPEPDPEEDYGPPEVPTLVNNRVVFRRRLDLEHEIAQNLSNGGLFVEAPPLPIRTKRQLTVEVAKVSWGVELQADVVFADGGRVGFSVINAVEAVAKLQEHLAGPAPAPSTLDMPTADMRAGAPETGGEAFIGSIVAPLSQRALLSLPDKQISDLSSVVRTTSLQLFEHFIAERWKGVLKLESGDQHLETWLHEGSVAFVIAKPYDEANSVGRILIHQKKLNEAGLREALESAKRNKKSLGRALVGLGLIKKADLSAALREQMRSKLSEGLLYEAGSFEWTPWREPPGDADLVLTKGVGIIAQHLRHRFEDLNASEVEALLGKNLARPIGHDNDLDQSTQGMHLQPKEQRFLELQLDGTRSVEDAVRGSPVGRLASLRLIALGLSLGVLHFTQGGRAARQATRIGSAPDQFARVSKDLQDSLHMLKSQNHFDVLGVHWSAHHRSYKDAYTKVKRQYDLKNPTLKGAPPAVMELARELLTIVDGAFEVLNDTRKRTEYRKHLFDGTERQYAADMLVKQGEVALMRGDRVGAIEALETAVELDPARRNRQLLTSAREGRR